MNTASAWLTDASALIVLTLLPLGGAMWVLRRRDTNR